jgi:L-threonylcarbamoyladenylate synthase
MSTEEHIKKAVQILKEGGVVIFPTDTAFGIGCRVDDEEAVKKVFSIRKRPTTQAVPVLCSSVEMVKEYVTDFPEKVRSLIDRYWPGALTVILPAQLEKTPSLVRGGGITIGTRIPNHASTLEMIRGLNVPIIGPSANFHGDPTPYEMADIDPRLYNLVDYIVPGVCSVKKESTVIDCSEEKFKIIRKGALDIGISE